MNSRGVHVVCLVILLRKLSERTGEDKEKTYETRFPTVTISIYKCDKKSTKRFRGISPGCGAYKMPNIREVR